MNSAAINRIPVPPPESLPVRNFLMRETARQGQSSLPLADFFHGGEVRPATRTDFAATATQPDILAPMACSTVAHRTLDGALDGLSAVHQAGKVSQVQSRMSTARRAVRGPQMRTEGVGPDWKG
jgi:hypothetical protein